jgi:hypothetical protein
MKRVCSQCGGIVRDNKGVESQRERKSELDHERQREGKRVRIIRKARLNQLKVMQALLELN